jgi:hypothetical protein
MLGPSEVTSLFEMMAQPEYLGKKVIEQKVFPLLEIDFDDFM